MFVEDERGKRGPWEEKRKKGKGQESSGLTSQRRFKDEKSEEKERERKEHGLRGGMFDKDERDGRKSRKGGDGPTAAGHCQFHANLHNLNNRNLQHGQQILDGIPSVCPFRLYVFMCFSLSFFRFLPPLSAGVFFLFKVHFHRWNIDGCSSLGIIAPPPPNSSTTQQLGLHFRLN